MLSSILACIAIQSALVQESSYTFKNMKLAYFMHKNPMQIGGEGFPKFTFIEKPDDRPAGFDAWLLPDKATNSIRTFGSSQIVKEVPQYLEMFDIKAKEIRVSIALRHLEFDLETKYEVTSLNNAWVGISAEEIGVEFKLRPRINDDGSVSVLIHWTESPGKIKAIAHRIRPNGKYTIGVDRANVAHFLEMPKDLLKSARVSAKINDK